MDVGSHWTTYPPSCSPKWNMKAQQASEAGKLWLQLRCHMWSTWLILKQRFLCAICLESAENCKEVKVISIYLYSGTLPERNFGKGVSAACSHPLNKELCPKLHLLHLISLDVDKIKSRKMAWSVCRIVSQVEFGALCSHPPLWLLDLPVFLPQLWPDLSHLFSSVFKPCPAPCSLPDCSVFL